MPQTERCHHTDETKTAILEIARMMDVAQPGCSTDQRIDSFQALFKSHPRPVLECALLAWCVGCDRIVDRAMASQWLTFLVQGMLPHVSRADMCEKSVVVRALELATGAWARQWGLEEDLDALLLPSLTLPSYCEIQVGYLRDRKVFHERMAASLDVHRVRFRGFPSGLSIWNPTLRLGKHLSSDVTARLLRYCTWAEIVRLANIGRGWRSVFGFILRGAATTTSPDIDHARFVSSEALLVMPPRDAYPLLRLTRVPPLAWRALPRSRIMTLFEQPEHEESTPSLAFTVRGQDLYFRGEKVREICRDVVAVRTFSFERSRDDLFLVVSSWVREQGEEAAYKVILSSSSSSSSRFLSSTSWRVCACDNPLQLTCSHTGWTHF